MTGEETPRNPYLIAIVVSMAAFMEVLDTTITNVSLTHIAGNLAASQDESTWVLTSYLVANGIVLPLSGWLAGVFGRKNFFLMCIGGFTLASFACGMATSLPMLIVFRLLQGFAGGGLQPMQQSIVMDSFSPEKRGSAFAITGMTMIAAPVLGPTLGGFITDNYSWRWIFFMNVPVGALALFLVYRLVYDPPHAKAKGFISIDYIGLSLVAIGLGAFQVVLDKGQEDDWFDSNFILFFTAVATVGILGAILWILRQKDPIIDIALFKIPSFGLSCLMVFFVGFSLYGCSTLLPLLLQSQFGYDATNAGLVLSPGGLAIIVLMPIAGKLTGKVQAKYLISFGMLTLSVGMWATSQFTPQSSYNDFVFLRVLQVVGLPFLFVPSGTMAFSQIPRDKSSKASALYSLMRNLGGSIGISILLSYVSRREQTHQTTLAQHLSMTNPVYRQTLSHLKEGVLSTGASPFEATATATGRIYRTLLDQAAILSYTDVFLFVGSITFVLAIVALFMPANQVGKKPGAAADAAGADAEPVAVH